MKILMVNRCGYPGYGSENYFLNLCRLLKERGHKIIIFTTKDGRNIDKEYADYFVDKIDIDNLKSIPLLRKMLFACKTIYSFEAKRKIERLIKDTSPDIVHIHDIKRRISPSILHTIKKFNIPVVYNLYDNHLICPNYRLFIRSKICEACKGNRYYNAVFKRCIRNSLPLSLLACIEQYVHRVFKMFKNNIDVFIVPSDFLRQKLIEYGMSSERIIRIPHFIFVADGCQPKHEFLNCIVYFGRLVEEKGVSTLIKAVKQIPEIKLLIIGDGHYRNELEKAVNNEKMNNVEFKGYMSKEDIRIIVKDAICVVVPSLWYDASPMVIYESLFMGKPVIGANIGGIPELVDDGVNGFLFKPGDVNDLVEKIRCLFNNKDKIRKMAENARKKALQNYTPDVHYEKILAVYQDLITKRQ